MTADLSKPEEVIAMFEEADRATGGLDIVHNNAGIMTGAQAETLGLQGDGAAAAEGIEHGRGMLSQKGVDHLL